MSRQQSRSAVRAGAEPERLSVDHAASPAMGPEANWKTHLVWLRSALSRRFGAESADDLSQEAYLRVVERTAESPVQNVRGLLMTVATNLARDRFRRRKVRDDYATSAQATAAAERSRTAEEDLQVKQAIMALPPDLRDTLLLSKIGGLTNREIAQRYGLTVRAIDKRLQKAITLFVAQLRD